MSREQLFEMARHNQAHAKAGTIDQTDDVFRIPASAYLDPERHEQERERIFKRLPLMLALSAELREPGDYKAMDVLGMPVLISRGPDGQVRAFVNSCSHRGAIVVAPGKGNASRFICPYHGWGYDAKGALVGIRSQADFGKIDKSCHGLPELPSAERAGLVWVILDPDSQLDIDTFLCGYDGLLGQFGFQDWHVASQRAVEGPNWKIAYDGYLDIYHLPVLHKETFGPKMPSRALYYAFGPHQRVNSPNPLKAEQPAEEWEDGDLMQGVWTIFPHVSIASFDAGGRGVLVSQLFPGETVGESITLQNYVTERKLGDEELEMAEKMADLLEYVVRQEDYATCLAQQRALKAGARREVLFGRNEGGGHRFHGWVEKLLALEDDELQGAFAAESRA